MGIVATRGSLLIVGFQYGFFSNVFNHIWDDDYNDYKWLAFAYASLWVIHGALGAQKGVNNDCSLYAFVRTWFCGFNLRCPAFCIDFKMFMTWLISQKTCWLKQVFFCEFWQPMIRVCLFVKQTFRAWTSQTCRFNCQNRGLRQQKMLLCFLPPKYGTIPNTSKYTVWPIENWAHWGLQ